MSDTALNSAIQATIDSMGKAISKPPMTKKLLSKPPFRFLYDAVMEVMKLHNVGSGLYTPDEVLPENVKNKPDKIAFLEKIIFMTAFAAGKPLAAKPSKIVAGLDPEATNTWLTVLAKVALKKIDTSEAVSRVLAGEKPDRKSSKSKSKPNGAAKNERESQVDSDKTSKRKDSDTKPRASGNRPGKAQGQRKPPPSEDEDLKRPPAATAAAESKPEAGLPNNSEPNIPNKVADAELDIANPPEPEIPNHRAATDRPMSRGGARQAKHFEDNALPDQGKRRYDRPSSARGRKREDPPVDDSQRVDVPEHDEDSKPREPSARRRQKKISADIAPAPEPTRQVEIIGDGDEDEDDEDDTFILVDQSDQQTSSVQKSPEHAEDNEEHGALMRKIQEKKEDRSAVESSEPSMNEAKRRKEQEIVSEEVEKLRSSIQTLCRTANPLGKIVDYVQEDVDAMQAEMTLWQQKLQKDNATLADEALITEKELQPYRVKLAELDQQIRDQEEAIRAVKMNTFENDERIHKLLRGITFAANA